MRSRNIILGLLAGAGALLLSSCGGLVSVSSGVTVGNGPFTTSVGWSSPVYTGPYWGNGPYWGSGPCWGNGPLWAGGGFAPGPSWNSPPPRPHNHWHPQINSGWQPQQPNVPLHRPSIQLQQYDNGSGLPGPAIAPGATEAV